MTKDSDEDRKRTEAAHWFVLLDNGKLTEHEREDYASWISNLDNARVFAATQRSCAAWDLSMDSDRNARSNRIAMRPGSRRSFLAASGVASLVIGGSILAVDPLYRSFFPKKAVLPTISDTERGILRTQLGEQRSVHLSDGSLVNLNVLTQLTYEIGPTSRNIDFQSGEAEFTVTPDSVRPFIVATPFRTVRTSDAIFDVRNRFENVEINVRDGSIFLLGGKVASAPNIESPQVLHAGEAVSYNRSETTPVRTVPLQAIGQWKDRIIIFKDTRLSDVITEVNLYFSDQISLVDADLGEEKVTLRLPVLDFGSTVTTIAGLFSLNVERASGGAFLKRKERRI